MAINWTTIDTAIKTWLDATVPTVTWYRGDQDIPRPSLPCGHWTWSNVGATLPAQGSADDDDPVYEVAPSSTLRQLMQHRRHRLEIQVESSSVVGATHALAIAETVSDSVRLNSVQDALVAAGLSLRADGSALDATALLGYAAESRAVVEFLATTATSQTEEVGRIETVTPLTGTVTT